jgi:plasmid maintenance system antidote protein VapI
MTADTALRLSHYFGISADFWMNLQSAYELDLARQRSGRALQRIPRRSDHSAESALKSEKQRAPYQFLFTVRRG